MKRKTLLVTALTLGVALAGSAVIAQVQTTVGYGPNPQLPQPDESLVPTVKVSKAVGWPAGGKPKVAEGLKVELYAGEFQWDPLESTCRHASLSIL